MSAVSTSKVSKRGQTSLPAEFRRRWGMEHGGEVGVIDLGGSALLVPGGLSAARSELRSVLGEHYEDALMVLDDPDLADQQ